MRKPMNTNAQEVLQLFRCKWCPIVLFIVYKKPIRFNKIKHHLETVSAKVLAETLDRLINEGMVERDGLTYKATNKGFLVGTHIGLIVKALSN